MTGAKFKVHAGKPCDLDELEQVSMEEWAVTPRKTCAAKRSLLVLGQSNCNYKGDNIAIFFKWTSTYGFGTTV